MFCYFTYTSITSIKSVIQQQHFHIHIYIYMCVCGHIYVPMNNLFLSKSKDYVMDLTPNMRNLIMHNFVKYVTITFLLCCIK